MNRPHAAALGVAALVLVVIVVLATRTPAPQNILDLNLQGHQNLAMHIHPHLTIEINGENITIPENIGVQPGKLRVIHTHDEPGILHVESPRAYTFILQDFFTIWGKPFNQTCILDQCADENHTLTVYVNGERDDRYGNIILKDKDEIRIVYAEK
jgi:hypothetical protein